MLHSSNTINIVSLQSPVCTNSCACQNTGEKQTSVLNFGFCLLCQCLGLAGGTPEASVLTQIASLPGSNPRKARLIKQYSKPTVDYDDAPTVAEVSLPWRRGINGGTLNSPFHSQSSTFILFIRGSPNFIFLHQQKSQKQKLAVLSRACNSTEKLCRMHCKILYWKSNVCSLNALFNYSYHFGI